MNELHTFIITYLKDGKMVTETFNNIVNYTFINAGLFWMREKGALTDNKDTGKWNEKQYWFNIKDIVKLESEGGRHFHTKREISEFKRDNLID